LLENAALKPPGDYSLGAFLFLYKEKAKSRVIGRRKATGPYVISGQPGCLKSDPVFCFLKKETGGGERKDWVICSNDKSIPENSAGNI
jgi:hypothetical protein